MNARESERTDKGEKENECKRESEKTDKSEKENEF